VTAVAGAPPPEPFFFDGPAGRLFAVNYPPTSTGDTGLGVVFVPAFAEEMNQSCRMVALQARALAGAGIGALVVDLYGTGDSAGDFRDARWETWRDDVSAAVAWLETWGRDRIGLLGVRLGGLLAMEVAAANQGRVDRAILWQPVARGERMLTQFLRLRVAASMGGSAAQETTTSLRETFASGQSTQIAGYEVAPELAAALDSADIAAHGPAAGVPVDWIEVVADAGRPVSPASRRVVDQWTDAGVPVAAATVPGDAFWSIQETTLVPELLEATTECLRAARP